MQVKLPHELLLTTRQNTKLRNALNNNLATDIKLSQAQIKKLIQSGGFLGKLLSKLAGPLMKVAMPLAKNVLANKIWVDKDIRFNSRCVRD